MKADAVKIHRMSDAYLENWDNGGTGVRKIYNWWRGGSDSYLGRCYATFKLKGSTVFIDFKQFLKAHPDLPIDELTTTLWDEYCYNAQRIRSTRQHTKSSLEHLFITEFMKTYGYSGEHNRVKLRLAFYCYLTTQCLGMVAEYETYVKLKDVCADSSVRLADSSDECKDVDLYIDDVPVSVKTFRAFRESSISRYRRKSPVPMLYVNENLDHFVVDADNSLQRVSSKHLLSSIHSIKEFHSMLT